MDIFEGKLYIQIGKVKGVSKQLQANPKADICVLQMESVLEQQVRLSEMKGEKEKKAYT